MQCCQTPKFIEQSNLQLILMKLLRVGFCLSFIVYIYYIYVMCYSKLQICNKTHTVQFKENKSGVATSVSQSSKFTNFVKYEEIHTHQI